MKQSTYKAALYMRLSKDDDGVSESSSIITQRKMLRSYAEEKGYSIYDEYVDDGFSGTNFERPDFKRMISDIERKKVNMVITKDLSRLGRDYIIAGQYTEIYFPSKGVRYIAINDGYDSDSPYSDIAPFKNVINEMYARDTSKKIRSAFVTRMKEGAFIGAFAPYGYQKDPNDKHHLVVDPSSGAVVQKMFSLAANGELPINIARYLNEHNIISPALYRCKNRANLDPDVYTKRREWTSATVTKMLRNVVYLGHTAQGKTTKVSFKSSIVVNNPRDEWILVKNTHDALIDEEMFDLVRRRTMARTCEKKGEFYNIFSGIAKCADCGRNMSATGTRKKGAKANLTCGGYKLYGSKECSNHFVDYDVLCEVVRSSLIEELQLSIEQHNKITRAAEKGSGEQKRMAKRIDEVDNTKKRLAELDRIVGKLYEDLAKGVISESRMNKLLKKYEGESEILEQNLALIEQKQELNNDDSASREKLSMLLNQIIEVQELTPKMLFKLIDHIEVEQGYFEKTDKGRIKHQRIRIFYRFQTKATIREYAM